MIEGDYLIKEAVCLGTWLGLLLPCSRVISEYSYLPSRNCSNNVIVSQLNPQIIKTNNILNTNTTMESQIYSFAKYSHWTCTLYRCFDQFLANDPILE